MTNRIYPESVKKELKHLELLSRKRKILNHLNAIANTIKQWKSETISEETALIKIAELVDIHENSWTEGSDVGIPIAKALTDGTLTREDFSDKTWKSIEVLVDLLSL